MGELVTCVQCGAEEGRVKLALSSKSGFKRTVCASPGGCRRRRELRDELAAGIMEGRRQAAAEIRAAVAIADEDDVTDWQRGYRSCAQRVEQVAARIAEGKGDET